MIPKSTATHHYSVIFTKSLDRLDMIALGRLVSRVHVHEVLAANQVGLF